MQRSFSWELHRTFESTLVSKFPGRSVLEVGDTRHAFQIVPGALENVIFVSSSLGIWQPSVDNSWVQSMLPLLFFYRVAEPLRKDVMASTLLLFRPFRKLNVAQIQIVFCFTTLLLANFEF